MSDLKVLAVVSEIFPLVKTGGLADVAGALPGALAPEGMAVTTLVPGYPSVTTRLDDAIKVASYDAFFGGPAWILSGRAGSLELFVLDAPHLFARNGNPYLGPDGRDWPDNPLRFGALARAAADIATGLVVGYLPDVLHAHDWQTGLAAAYLAYDPPGPRPGTVMTVHNLAFQGQYPADLLAPLGLPARAMAIDGVEYYGMIGFLKGGLQLSDRITTVSPTYAAEIRTSEIGMGLDGLLRARAGVVSGILNGIDTEVWNPAADPLIPVPYDVKWPKGRAASKAALQARLELASEPEAPLLGVVSRLSWQKGLDLLLDTVPLIVEAGAQLAVVGAGDPALESGFRAAAAAYPGRIGCAIGYDEGLAHLMQAGSDSILVPSRFEPCGLTQLCALRYGALPLVARVGGLADTVIDANEMARAEGVGTGFQFAPVTREMLEATILRAVALWRDQAAWRRLQRNAMKTDVSWARPAKRYAELFRELARERAP